MWRRIVLILTGLLLSIQSVAAVKYEVVSNSILGTNTFGVLIDLHIQDFFPTSEAIMYYNYVALILILAWAGFSTSSSEHRFMFSTPLFAAAMIWLGWLRAYNPLQYWGSIVCCMLIGVLMYMDTANKEKRGTGGAGQKILTVAFTIMAFSAAFGFVASSNIIPFTTSYGSSSNTMCGSVYSCDAAGNPTMSAEVTKLSSVGGATSDASSLTTTASMIWLIFWTVVAVIGSVLMFSAVAIAAFPVLSTSTPALLFLGIFQIVTWAIYLIAIFNWFAKPGYNQGEI